MTNIHNPSNLTTQPLPQVTQNQEQLSITQPIIQPTGINPTVDSIMERAGLVRGAGGGLTVRDTTSIGKTQEVAGLASFEKVYGTGKSQLKPVAPPRVEFTTELKVGAETFANNVDKVINDLMVKNGPVNKNIMLQLKNISDQQTKTQSTKGGDGLWSIPDKIVDTPEVQKLIDNYLGIPSTTADGQVRGIQDLTADMLLAAFLKLNITDPNNSVETHQQLHKAMSLLRDMAIKEAQAKEAKAAKVREEAMKEADSAKYVSDVMNIVRIVIVVIVLIVAIVCAIIPGTQGITVLLICAAVAICAATVVEADANKNASTASCDAAAAGLMGQQAQLMAEKFQEQLKDEGEIMQTIMESKNKVVDAILRMMNAMFGSAQKLMSAGMAKG